MPSDGLMLLHFVTFKLKVIFSGSSAIRLQNARFDLSRRAVLYRVNGMSFREFIEFETGQSLSSYTLEEILMNHTQITYDLRTKFKPFEYFEKYLKYGYYPFYKENLNTYSQKLNEIINVVLESDLPIVFNIEPKNISKLKKLLSLLCISKPYELNITKLSQKIEINRNTLYNYLNYLNYLEAGSLIRMIRQHAKGESIFVKPEKLYLNNTNLNDVYCQSSDTGTLRESFFANQLAVMHDVSYAKKGDFLIDDRYTVEVGGKKKSYEQIKDLEDSFIAADGIEAGFGNKIPLWLFGFMY